MKQISRRRFLGLAAIAGAGGLVAACQPQAVEKPAAAPVAGEAEKPAATVAAAPEPAQATLRLAEGSWVGPEGIKYWTDNIIPKFESENPGIKVTFESAESNDYADKLYTQAVAGDAPDVFFIWWSAGLMEQGQLLELDSYFDKEYLADFYPGNVVGQVYNGHLYGIPKYISTVAMAYNKDILDAAGVKYPDANWTWNDYLDAFQKCTTRDDSGKATQWGTYVSKDFLHPGVWANGGEWMNADLFGTKCLLDQPKAMQALQFDWDLVYGKDPLSPMTGSVADKDWTNVFSTGKVAFMESHSWTVTNYLRENNFKWDFTDLPKSPNTDERAGLTFVNGYSSYAKTKFPKEAVKLMDFLVSAWAQEQGALGILGLQPSRRSMAAVWDEQSQGAKAGYDVAAFNRIMDKARLTPIFKDDKRVLDEVFNPIWDKIWVTGDLGLKDGVTQIVQGIDELNL
jgi:ABC-type glycerol-3-phosphate transport system substrate-binding protein